MGVYNREGWLGTYYGSPYRESGTLTQAQMEVNARYIHKYWSEMGITTSAICGILGNMQVESGLNPGRWQSDNVENLSGGYGLVQWTPATDYFKFFGYPNWDPDINDPSTMDENLYYIIEYESQHKFRYYPTDEYPLTLTEFVLSTKSPGYLAKAFLYNYERAGVEAVDKRVEYANYWYEFLTGSPPPYDPDDPTPTPTKPKKRKGYNFVLFNRRRRIYG
jgi:hypothetical protein